MSKTKIALLIGAVLIVAVLAVGGGAAYVFAKDALAPGDGPPTPFRGDGGFFFGRGGRHGMWGFAGGDVNPMDMFNAAAEALGLTPEELFAELQAGKTPQEILEERDVDWTTLREEMQEVLPEGFPGFGGARGRMGRLGGFGKLDAGPLAMLDGAAEALGMTSEELVAELRAGKTLQEVVEAQGFELEPFLSDVARPLVEQAIEDGRLTQEQADWLLEGLEQGYIPMPMPHGERGRWGPCAGEELDPSSE